MRILPASLAFGALLAGSSGCILLAPELPCRSEQHCADGLTCDLASGACVSAPRPDDAGVVPRDDGGLPLEDGGIEPEPPPTDGGPIPNDGGPIPNDGGPIPNDGGPLPNDGGPIPNDAGPIPNDAGAPFDGGAPPFDAGAPPFDAGPPPDDCGNGRIDPLSNEECDDGNTTPGDGCDGSCTLEPNAYCLGTPNICADVADIVFFGTFDDAPGGADVRAAADLNAHIASGDTTRYVFLADGTYDAGKVDAKDDPSRIIVGSGPENVRITSSEGSETVKLQDNGALPYEFHGVTIDNTAGGRALKSFGGSDVRVYDSVIGPALGNYAIESAGDHLTLERVEVREGGSGCITVNHEIAFTNVLVHGCTGGVAIQANAGTTGDLASGLGMRFVSIVENDAGAGTAGAMVCGGDAEKAGLLVAFNSIDGDGNEVADGCGLNFSAARAPNQNNPLDCMPLLRDRAGEDFRLLAGSPCDNALGASPLLLDDVTTDLTGGDRPLGNGFDPGAFETDDTFADVCGNADNEFTEFCDLGVEANGLNYNGSLTGGCTDNCNFVGCGGFSQTCPTPCSGQSCSTTDGDCNGDDCFVTCVNGADCTHTADGTNDDHTVVCVNSSCELDCNSVNHDDRDPDCAILCVGNSVCQTSCNSVDGACDIYCEAGSVCINNDCSSVGDDCATDLDPDTWPY